MYKKKFGLFLIVIVMAVVISFNVNINTQDKGIQNVTLANIEALADEGGFSCQNACKEWSGSSGGGIACDCGRYSGKCKSRC